MYEVRLEKDNSLIECVGAKITKEINKIDLLSFTLYPLSKNYIEVERYVTNIYVIDTDISKVVFSGQVIDISDYMDSDGVITKSITCFSKLDYLNRTKTKKWDVHPGQYQKENETESEVEKNDPYIILENMNVKKYLKVLLDNHNSKIEDESKKIYLGNVTVEDNVTCSCDREDTLKEIQTLAENKNAYINLREENNKLYLDFLKEVNIQGPDISEGINLKSAKREGTLEKPITRLIPLGKDKLTIKSVNNNVEYIEDEKAKSIYGVIEEVETWDDVTIADNLLKKAKQYLSEINRESYSIDISALDLSYINLDFNRFDLFQTCNIFIEKLGVYEEHMIRKITINVDEPFNSSLEFSNATYSLLKRNIKQNKMLQNSLKSLEKKDYDISNFKIETKTNINNITETENKNKIYRIMEVF